MELSVVLGFLRECLFLLIILGIFLFTAFKKGRQTVTNIILGLYLALLISKEFPFYDSIFSSTTAPQSEAAVMLAIFMFFTVIATLLFSRILPREYDETAMEGFGRKLLLAIGGTILVIIFSYHVLPITEFIHPGSPINYLFGSAEYFFYWLLVPLIILFFV